MNIFHELGRLQIAVREAEPFDQYRGILDDDPAERIAGMRRVLMLDQARQSRATAAHRGRQRLHLESIDRVEVCGRLVRIPARVLPVLRALGRTTGALSSIALATAAFDNPSRAASASEHARALDGILKVQDCGLSIHRSRFGYTLIADPLTLAQAQEARSAG